jgi:hypothetical protein
MKRQVDETASGRIHLAPQLLQQDVVVARMDHPSLSFMAPFWKVDQWKVKSVIFKKNSGGRIRFHTIWQKSGCSVVLSTWHFGNLTFTSAWHFVFFQLYCLSTWHFVNQTFFKLDIMSSWHFVLCQLYCVPIWHFVNQNVYELDFYQPDFLLTDIFSTSLFVSWHFANQSTIHFISIPIGY